MAQISTTMNMIRLKIEEKLIHIWSLYFQFKFGSVFIVSVLTSFVVCFDQVSWFSFSFVSLQLLGYSSRAFCLLLARGVHVDEYGISSASINKIVDIVVFFGSNMWYWCCWCTRCVDIAVVIYDIFLFFVICICTNLQTNVHAANTTQKKRRFFLFFFCQSCLLFLFILFFVVFLFHLNFYEWKNQ